MSTENITSNVDEFRLNTIKQIRKKIVEDKEEKQRKDM